MVLSAPSCFATICVECPYVRQLVAQLLVIPHFGHCQFVSVIIVLVVLVVFFLTYLSHA